LTMVALPLDAMDDPWPIGILSFVMDKNSFGKDEVNDARGSASNGLFSNADYINNAPDDTSTHEVRGCTVLFIYYLFHQLSP